MPWNPVPIRIQRSELVLWKRSPTVVREPPDGFRNSGRRQARICWQLNPHSLARIRGKSDNPHGPARERDVPRWPRLWR